LQANPTDVTQTISDLDITISSGSTAGSTLASSSSQGNIVAPDGTFDPGPPISTPGWGLTAGTSTTLSLDDTGPFNFILGPPGSGSLYSNADASIVAGSSEFSPFLNIQAIFMISGAGLTADTIISGVDFSFGNSPSTNVPGVPPVTTTPLPTALPLFGTGLGALGLLGWRRKRKAQMVVA
jgi:hypothetical protein